MLCCCYLLILGSLELLQLLDTTLEIEILAFLVSMLFSLAVPRQIVFFSSAFVERDQEACASVTVLKRNLMLLHVLLGDWYS